MTLDFASYAFLDRMCIYEDHANSGRQITGLEIDCAVMWFLFSRSLCMAILCSIAIQGTANAGSTAHGFL